MEAMGDREEKQSTAKSLKQESGINQMEMAHADAIAAHPLWRKSVVCITQLEASREFCRHDVTHFLDVARLAWIENLERGLGVSKEEIYAAALLHDIGRHLQYEKGIPHDEASVQLGGQILSDCPELLMTFYNTHGQITMLFFRTGMRGFRGAPAIFWCQAGSG